MTGYRIVNLLDLIEELGEDAARGILSEFSCPMNQDVESFLSEKAIIFAKQGWAQTDLIFASYKDEWKLVAYFTLAPKYIKLNDSFLKTNTGRPTNKTLRKRIAKFAQHDPDMKAYILSAPLIGQLGKNYTDGLNTLITGDEVLEAACGKIQSIQASLGGRFAYLECEDKPKLLDFYERNGLCPFCNRPLDADETNLSGEYLVQLIKYIHT